MSGAVMNEFTSVRELLEEAHSRTEELITELGEKWRTMYAITPDFVQKRHGKFLEYLTELYNDIRDTEENKRLELLSKIEMKMKELIQLKKDLNLSSQDLPWEREREPYTQFLEEIEAEIKKFEVLKEERLSRYREIRAEEKSLCDYLEIAPLPEFPRSIPTLNDLEDVESHIFSMREQKINRVEYFKETRTKFIDIMRNMEATAETEFECDVLSLTENEFVPSTSNINKLKELLSRWERDYDRQMECRAHLLEVLTKLWDRLKIEPAERDEFLAKYPTVASSHMKALKDEIERCKELRKANLQPIIESVRREISSLWEMLRFGEEQRAEFRAFSVEHISEDLLQLHELELDRLNYLHDKYRHIYELAEKREKLWLRMLHLDVISKDKSRLFSNRGGQLLKEEKERKTLESSLPKIDRQLKSALTEFEATEGRPFLWDGYVLLEKITEEWNARLESKETKKPSKKDGDDGMRLATKRALLTPGSSTEAKMRRVNYQVGSTESLLPNGRNTKTPKRLPAVRTPSRIRTPVNLSMASIASYSHFQDGLEEAEVSGAATPRLKTPRPALREMSSCRAGRSGLLLTSSPALAPSTGRKATPISSAIPRITTHRSRQRLHF